VSNYSVDRHKHDIYYYYYYYYYNAVHASPTWSHKSFPLCSTQANGCEVVMCMSTNLVKVVDNLSSKGLQTCSKHIRAMLITGARLILRNPEIKKLMTLFGSFTLTSSIVTVGLIT
jgi:hypothetical protein